MTQERLEQLFRRMKVVWSSVPKVHCKGLCQKECGNVPLLPVEALYLEQKLGRTFPEAVHGNRFVFKTLGDKVFCPFLTEISYRGRCSIYEDRPMICRSYGHDIDALRCEWGCEVERPMTTLSKVHKILIQISQKCGVHIKVAR